MLDYLLLCSELNKKN